MMKKMVLIVVLLVVATATVATAGDRNTLIADYFASCARLGVAVGTNNKAKAVAEATVLGKILPQIVKIDGMSLHQGIEVFEKSSITSLKNKFREAGREMPRHVMPLLKKSLGVVRQTALNQ
jgi:hypothetical protein